LDPKDPGVLECKQSLIILSFETFPMGYIPKKGFDQILVKPDEKA